MGMQLKALGRSSLEALEKTSEFQEYHVNALELLLGTTLYKSV